LTVFATAVAQTQSKPTGQQKEALERAFKGVGVTARIELPLRRGLHVNPDGSLDLEDYRRKLSGLPPSLEPNDRAVITRLETKSDTIEVSLNGGGVWGAVHQGHLKWYTDVRPDGRQDLRGAGSRLDVRFRRPLTSADMDPRVLAVALSKILAIDGFAPPPPAPAARPAPQPPPQSRPQVELLAVEVDPPRVPAGRRVRLVMRLRISGLVGQDTLSIVEERRLFRQSPSEAEPISRTASWGNGLHTTTWDFDVPMSVPPGVYTFAGALRWPGGAATREALFAVVH
jgi:hypothetical protein